MLRYVGGKTRLAKELSAVIYSYKTDAHRRYLEPFFGGGSMAQYTKDFNLNRYASDINQDLILMYQALQDDWLPPEHITEEQYTILATSEPSALRGYVGFGLSFAGIWFVGYAKDKSNKRRFDEESYRRLVKNIPYIQDITFRCKDYQTIKGINSIDLIYCDPPYAHTFNKTSHHKGYATGDIDHTLFWDIMRQWSNNGATVLISEYTAPDDFIAVWEKPYKTYGITKQRTKDKVEKVFKYRG